MKPQPFASYVRVKADGEPPRCVWIGGLQRENADDPDLVRELRMARVGSTIWRGGGAAPLVGMRNGGGPG